jgi:hypothetical protein
LRLKNSALTSANLLFELFPALAVLLFAQELSLLAGLPAPQVLLQDEHAGSDLPPRLVESRLGQPATNARLHHHNFLELQQKKSVIKRSWCDVKSVVKQKLYRNL